MLFSSLIFKLKRLRIKTVSVVLNIDVVVWEQKRQVACELR